jgi:hemerythrin-like metal-binding protein
MATIEWGAELSVGDEVIDRQHMVLVRAINLLSEAVANHSSKDLLGEIFDILTDYTVTHFVYEEDRFQRAGYPDSAEHVREHESLLLQVVELRSKWQAGEAEIGPAVLDFLVAWLRNHIVGSDKRYAPYLARA